MKHWGIYCMVFLMACTSTEKPVTPELLGDQTISVFEEQPLYFDMAFKDSLAPQEGIYALDAGRVLMKQVVLPRYQQHTNITINMQLVSNGDPWDKYGSVFVLPKGSLPFTVLENEEGLVSTEAPYPAVTAEGQYLPALELLRFMTPFGVGYYSDTLDHIKPVYIPEWEKEVQWSQNITHLAGALCDTVWVGVFIDTWTKEGYRLSIDLEFDESEVPYHEATPLQYASVVNTVKYLPLQKLYDGFAQQALEASFTLPDSATNVQLHYLVSGHGGHAGGDEFVECKNVLAVNGKEVHRFTPWRNDCASFRRFNPSSGVWTQEIEWRGETMQERIASSDLSRSNWCPGSDVPPVVIPLNGLGGGTHQLSIAMPTAQPIEDNAMNHWLVSAYVTWEN